MAYRMGCALWKPLHWLTKSTRTPSFLCVVVLAFFVFSTPSFAQYVYVPEDAWNDIQNDIKLHCRSEHWWGTVPSYYEAKALEALSSGVTGVYYVALVGKVKLLQSTLSQAYDEWSKLPFCSELPKAYIGIGLGGQWTGCPDYVITYVITKGFPDTTNNGQRWSCGSTGFDTSVYGGYNWTLGSRWVVGIEGDIGYATNNKTSGIPGVSSAPGDTYNMQENWNGAMLARLGYAVASRVIVYATGGVAVQHVEATVTCSSMTSPCGRFGAVSPFSATEATTRTGWAVGGAVEYALAASWKLRGEYRYADFGNYYPTFGNPANISVGADIRLRTNTALLGLTFAFGGTPAPAAASLPPAAKPILTK